MNSTSDKFNESLESSNLGVGLQMNNFHVDLNGDVLSQFIYFLTISLSHIVGPLLVCGIIIFEKNGGDRQKRNIINRLLSLALVNNVVFTFIDAICIVWKEIFGLIDFSVMLKIEFFGYVTTTNFIILSNQITAIKYLHIIVWKRVRELNDEFLTFFLSCTSICLSICIWVVEHMKTHHSVILPWFRKYSADFPVSAMGPR